MPSERVTLRFDELLQYRHQRSRTHAKHEYTIDGFERAEQLSQPDKQGSPHDDLHKGSEHHCQHDDEERTDACNKSVRRRHIRRLPNVVTDPPERDRHLHDQAQQHGRDADHKVHDDHVFLQSPVFE